MGDGADDVRDASHRYYTFLSLSGDGVARMQIDPPLRTSAPEDEQVVHLLSHSRVAECNELFAGTYGRTKAQMVGLLMADFVPRDEPARIAGIREFVRAGYRLVYSEEEQAVSGSGRRWLSASALGSVADGRLEEFWVCLRDITTRKRQELDRERRGRILEAVASASARLLQPGAWQARAEEVLAQLGEAAQVARAWLAEFVARAEGPPWLEFRASWGIPGSRLELEDPRVRDGLSLEDLGLAHVAEELRQGRDVRALASQLTPAARTFLSGVESKSFAAVPVVARGRTWGVLGFGETRYEREWSTPEVEALKAAAGVVGAAIERESADDALRESEERFQRLSSAAFEGIAITEDGRFVDGNDQLAEMLGVRLSDLVGRPVREFVALEDRGVVAARIDSGVEGPYQHLALRPDGATFPVEVRARSLPHRGRTLRVTALRDVSARVKAEERQRRLEDDLRQAADEWRQTFDSLDLGIVLADAEGRVVRLNRSALAAAAAASFADVPGQPLASLATREPWRTLLDLYHQVGEQRGSVVAEAREPESQRAFYLLGSPWFRGVAEPPWRVLSFRDVTAFTTLQEQLRQARVMEAMGSLVAGVAHEVRNPLFSISATLDAIDSTMGERPEFAEHAALLRSQVGRLTQLTRDLLDYGRPQALQRAPSDLGVIVRRAVRACATASRERGVSIEERVAGELPRLELDAARMEQALENLVTNAVQHSSKGGVVSVICEPARRDGEPFVRCVVEDRGPGLAPENLARVFEPFFTRRKGGTGLGLSIVRRLVEAHAGRVSAENREGGGARFSVWLPVRRQQEAGGG